MLLEVKIKGVALDPLTNVPIVLLKAVRENQSLPIWIGFFEANAIISHLEQVNYQRPMTHDLLKTVIEALEGKVRRVLITRLQENTFYAVIEILQDGKTMRIDSRPSDAIALALRVNAPFFVEEEVFRKARKIDLSRLSPPKDNWEEWLQKARPDDFGKYRM